MASKKCVVASSKLVFETIERGPIYVCGHSLKTALAASSSAPNYFTRFLSFDFDKRWLASFFRSFKLDSRLIFWGQQKGKKK